MLRDITFGQYYQANSPVHRLDPRTKLLLSVVYIVFLFCAEGILGYLLIAGFTISLYLISRVPLAMSLRNLKPVLPLILLTALLNLFFVQDGEVLWQWGWLRLTAGGVLLAVTMAVRIVFLIAGTAILTYTTLPLSLTDGIEQLLSPLARIRFPAHELAMMMTIALRFIPTLLEEAQKLLMAQKARGADLENGNPIKRFKSYFPIFIPLFVSSFRRAEELAIAMEARCYHGGKGRTRLRKLHYASGDLVAFLVVFAFGATVIFFRIFFPGWML